jgi:phage terminase large subunit-like protein
VQTSSSLPFEPSKATWLLSQFRKELERRAANCRLTDYKPYPKQREFHAAGAHYRERMLMAGNQLGKTLSAAYETAMHLTGRYPSWWEGKRFNRPVRWIAGSESSELTRKGIQRLLLGPPENESEWGTGSIPKECLADWSRKQGVPDAVASILVKHETGGVSSIQLQSYDQGRSKWQADTLDGGWLDEEPPLDILTECLTRTNTTMGPIYITLTPLEGVSEVVRRFYIEKVPGTHLTMMTIFDVEHYTDEQRAAIIASYPEHERKARTQGIPQLGSGRVFPFERSQIACESFPIPEHWTQGCGIDFGWDHPSAGVRMAWDRDSDCLYVIAAHRAKAQTPMMFAAATLPWGGWLPWAWPHDGKQSGGKFDQQEQQQLQAIYKKHGLAMLFQHAQFEDGTNGVEAGITEMYERMETGRWKVFAHLADWFEEFELYHRKDGLIVKLNDDLISASRYAMMMRRHFTVQKKPKKRQEDEYGQGPRADGLGWMA